MPEATQNQPQVPASALPPGEKGAEHLANMLKVVDSSGGGAPETPSEKLEEPKKLAGKYESVEELEKAYEELQKKLGQTKPKEGEGEPVKKTDPTDPDLGIEKKADEVKAAEDAVKTAGLDWNALSAEFASKGELSEDSYKALGEKAGIPREMVDQFIEGQIAVAERARNTVFEAVGGQETYASMIEWAQANMSADEIAAYNNIASSRNIGAIKIAAAGLKARFDAAGGSEPKLIGGDIGTGSTGFKSQDELVEAMSNPKYHSDPAYRKSVMDRLRVSSY